MGGYRTAVGRAGGSAARTIKYRERPDDVLALPVYVATKLLTKWRALK